MKLSETEKKVIEHIDKNAEKIIAFAKNSMQTPEHGYCEKATARLVKDEFEKMGIPYRNGMAVTGVKGQIGKSEDFNVAIIGELDAVTCFGHDECNPKTGAAHACGHNAQLAAMMGVAYGLSESGVMDELDGKVSFFAVPAEEYIEIDYRRKLRDEGKIKFFGGKQQLIYEGEFDSVDAAMMVHAQSNTPGKAVFVHGGSLGFLGKTITFKGRAVHASTPFDGVNALNAAALSILGIHANRETFHDEDKIRIHPIITKGGDVVNSVPDEVCMDSYIRGASMSAIKKASAAADRAILGAAQMVGATAEIETSCGYLPLKQDHNLGELFKEVALEFIPGEKVYENIDMTGSTDIGDLSHLIPVIQPTVGGFDGLLHSREFHMTDAEAAIIIPAKIMAVTAVRLLKNKAELGRKIKQEFTPLMTKEEYLNTQMK